MTVQPLNAAQKRRNQRVSRYHQLVRPLACHYARFCREPLDDLIQVGLLGLLRAAELYSPQTGTPFEAFARPHVRGAILHYLRDVAPSLRLPRRLGERRQQVQQTRQQWLRLYGREPRAQEICRSLGLNQAQWLQVQQAGERALVVPMDQATLEQACSSQAVRGPEPVDLRPLEALARLQLPIRETVRLVVLEGRSYRKAAGQLQVSPMTVQRRLRRGLAELRQLLTAAAGCPDPSASAAAGC